MGERDGSVERDGAHHLRLRELRWLAPYLPDTGVGLTPERADEVGELSQTSCVLVLELARGLGQPHRGEHHLAVDVELELARGAVADAYRHRAAVAGERHPPARASSRPFSR